MINRQCLDKPFAWQPRYHDHIIRDAGELERIRWYICRNPANWEQDRNHDTDDGFC
jgi:putative transposase